MFITFKCYYNIDYKTMDNQKAFEYDNGEISVVWKPGVVHMLQNTLKPYRGFMSPAKNPGLR